MLARVLSGACWLRLGLEQTHSFDMRSVGKHIHWCDPLQCISEFSKLPQVGGHGGWVAGDIHHPRGGLAKKVVGRVAAAAPARVVYVSCNPTTMASNLRQFAELGYALQRITPVDMFPHTPHIEAVGLLKPKP